MTRLRRVGWVGWLIAVEKELPGGTLPPGYPSRWFLLKRRTKGRWLSEHIERHLGHALPPRRTYLEVGGDEAKAIARAILATAPELRDFKTAELIRLRALYRENERARREVLATERAALDDERRGLSEQRRRLIHVQKEITTRFAADIRRIEGVLHPDMARADRVEQHQRAFAAWRAFLQYLLAEVPTQVIRAAGASDESEAKAHNGGGA